MALNLGAREVLLVIDPGVIAAGRPDEVVSNPGEERLPSCSLHEELLRAI